MKFTLGKDGRFTTEITKPIDYRLYFGLNYGKDRVLTIHLTNDYDEYCEFIDLLKHIYLVKEVKSNFNEIIVKKTDTHELSFVKDKSNLVKVILFEKRTKESVICQISINTIATLIDILSEYIAE